MNSLFGGLGNPQLSVPHHLLDIAPEIRVKIYGYLFDVNVPIPISIGSDGYPVQPTEDQATGLAHQKITLPVQLLRTSRQLFDEATVYLYGVNTFLMLSKETWRLELLQMAFGTRLCISKLEILFGVGQQPDYAAIGRKFPAVCILDVTAYGPGPAMLLATYELSKSLVCSEILGNEPLLELHISAPQTEPTLLDNDIARAQKVHYNIPETDIFGDEFKKKFDTPDTFKLNSLDTFAKPVLRLGRGMPDFSAVRVHGELHPNFVHAIRDHESSFGDCSFEEVRATEVNDEGFQTLVYVWKRRGTIAKAIRGKDLVDTAALMRGFVPKLSQKYLEAIKQAGLDTNILEKSQDKNRARAKEKAKENTDKLAPPQKPHDGSVPPDLEDASGEPLTSAQIRRLTMQRMARAAQAAQAPVNCAATAAVEGENGEELEEEEDENGEEQEDEDEDEGSQDDDGSRIDLSQSGLDLLEESNISSDDNDILALKSKVPKGSKLKPSKMLNSSLWDYSTVPNAAEAAHEDTHDNDANDDLTDDEIPNLLDSFAEFRVEADAGDDDSSAIQQAIMNSYNPNTIELNYLPGGLGSVSAAATDRIAFHQGPLPVNAPSTASAGTSASAAGSASASASGSNSGGGSGVTSANDSGSGTSKTFNLRQYLFGK